jgi:hypothetical protein
MLGYIKPEELKKALIHLNIQLTPTELDQILKFFNVSEGISTTEFIKNLVSLNLTA